MSRYTGLTHNMMVNEIVQARCRKDGGSLYELEIWHEDGNHGFEVYDPRTAEMVKRDLEFYGAKVVMRKVQ